MDPFFSFPSFSFCTLPNRKIVVGFGEEQKISTPSFNSPLFYSPSFFLDQKQKPWSAFSEIKVMTKSEFLGWSASFYDQSLWRWEFLEKERYFAAVNDALKEICNGTLKKAVPYTYASCQKTVSKDVVKSMIRHASSRGCLEEYLIGSYRQEEGIIALTPERLFSLKGNLLETVSLAGTILEEEPDHLLKSKKMALEQKIVTKAIVEALAPFGRVEKGKTQIVTRGKLKHLQTQIFCSLKSTPPIEELVFALHPTPAVGGAPKDKALAWLRNFSRDEEKRSFGAPFGVFFPKEQEAHVYVCIRGVEWRKDIWKMGIGCGVVEGSCPDIEWQEVEKKFMNLRYLLGV